MEFSPILASAVALHPPTQQAGLWKKGQTLQVWWAAGWFGHPGAWKELQPHSQPGEPIPAAEPSFKDVWAEQNTA